MEGQWADLMTSFGALAGWTMASSPCEASAAGRGGRSRGKDGADEVQPLPQGSVFGDSTEADLRLPDTWDLIGMVLGTGGAPCSGSLDLTLVEPGVDPSEPLPCCVFLCHSLTLSGLSFPTSIA